MDFEIAAQAAQQPAKRALLGEALRRARIGQQRYPLPDSRREAGALAGDRIARYLDGHRLTLRRQRRAERERQESRLRQADIDEGSFQPPVDLQHAAEKSIAHHAVAAFGELPGALKAAVLADQRGAKRPPFGGDEQSPHGR